MNNEELRNKCYAFEPQLFIFEKKKGLIACATSELYTDSRIGLSNKKEVVGVTLQKVAKLAGVSVSTASKALSNSKEVSEETKALVLKAAAELSYFSTVKKRRFENRRHSCITVGIICPEIISVHYSEIVTALCRSIDEMGGKASIFITEFDKDKQKHIFDRCVSEKEIDAIISLEGFEISHDSFSLPIPAVFLGGKGKNSVNSNLSDGIYKAVRHFADMGHKKIAFAGEPLTISKAVCFEKAMLDIFGACDQSIIFCENGRFEESGRAAGAKICALEPNDRPTAVLCAYDEIAYGLIRTMRENSLRVPEDISVIGINDIPTSRFLETPLTSVRNNTEGVVSKVMEILSNQLSQNMHEAEPVFVPCELVIRASVTKI